MRITVLILDTLIYVPAVVVFAQVWQGSRSKRTQVCLALIYISQAHCAVEPSIIDFAVPTCAFADRFWTFPIQLDYAGSNATRS